MTKRNAGTILHRTKQENYYDGFEEWYDEELVSKEFSGEYILQEAYEQEKYDTYDDDVIWLKNEAQKKYYREPHKPVHSKVEV
ncbi:hypothetical protein [Paenibacillus sp. Marseille-Q4541]|uniref:hypothetical protein n=1 Tax=Paenibacillus sp. Marseille-Q4541 TaxID=2831522 RepID=UPI001BABD3F6|nr:hypothetical protein [Paenibacillus sp. Marseille-Q4541]